MQVSLSYILDLNSGMVKSEAPRILLRPGQSLSLRCHEMDQNNIDDLDMKWYFNNTEVQRTLDNVNVWQWDCSYSALHKYSSPLNLSMLGHNLDGGLNLFLQYMVSDFWEMRQSHGFTIFCLSFLTKPWLILFHNFVPDLFCEVLHEFSRFCLFRFIY